MSNIKGKVKFITTMIDAFAQQNSLNKQQAYRYIRRDGFANRFGYGLYI